MIVVRPQILVHKNAIAILPCLFLQRQSNQIAKTPKGHHVLAGKEAIIRCEVDLGTFFHRLRDQGRTHLPGGPCRNGFGEEYPDMATIPRPRPLESSGDSFRMTGAEQGPGIIRPAVLVEVRGEEPACFVLQQWIHTRDEVTRAGIAAAQMLFDDVLGWWDKCLMRAFSTFRLRFATDPSHPFIGTGWRIS